MKYMLLLSLLSVELANSADPFDTFGHEDSGDSFGFGGLPWIYGRERRFADPDGRERRSAGPSADPDADSDAAIYYGYGGYYGLGLRYYDLGHGYAYGYTKAQGYGYQYKHGYYGYYGR